MDTLTSGHHVLTEEGWLKTICWLVQQQFSQEERTQIWQIGLCTSQGKHSSMPFSQYTSYQSSFMHTGSNMTNSQSTSLRKEHLGGKLNCVVMPDVTALVSILFVLPNVSTYGDFTSKNLHFVSPQDSAVNTPLTPSRMMPQRRLFILNWLR